MKPRKTISLFFVLCTGLTGLIDVKANELSIRTDEILTGNQLSLGFNNTQFITDAGSIQGSGIKIDFTHFFASKLSMELYLSAAFSMDKKIQNSFTGLGGVVNYTVFGQCFQTKKNVYINDMLAASETSTQTNCLTLGGSVQQFFLNGSKNIYSGSGVGINGSYHFTAWDYNMKAYAGYSMISAGKTQLNSINLGLSFIFSL